MTVWIDAQLSPALASWITRTFGVSAVALRDIGLRDATDYQIFVAAKEQRVIVMSTLPMYNSEVFLFQLFLEQST